MHEILNMGESASYKVDRFEESVQSLILSTLSTENFFLHSFLQIVANPSKLTMFM